MINLAKPLAPVTRKGYIEQNFIGRSREVEGIVVNVDYFAGQVIVHFKTVDGGVHISAAFSNPNSPKLRFVESGSRIRVVGLVADVIVSPKYVALKECKLLTEPLAPFKNKEWWETKWIRWSGGVIGTVIASVVAGIIVRRLK